MNLKKKYLEMVAQDNVQMKHADGSICKAASPDSCPFNKKAEQGDTEISGEEKKAEAGDFSWLRKYCSLDDLSDEVWHRVDPIAYKDPYREVMDKVVRRAWEHPEKYYTDDGTSKGDDDKYDEFVENVVYDVDSRVEDYADKEESRQRELEWLKEHYHFNPDGV